jgi:hypothetical protein
MAALEDRMPPFFGAVSSGGSYSACDQRTASAQLQQVVHQADQIPFPLLLKAPQDEIAKPKAGLDLAEHRFDDHPVVHTQLSPSLFNFVVPSFVWV